MKTTLLAYFILTISLLAGSLLGDEEIDHLQDWPSPNGDYHIAHGPAASLFDPPADHSVYAVWTLSSHHHTLWAGVSTIDESAHSFRCLWTRDSRFALILDRPNRATTGLALIKTGKTVEAFPFQTQQIIDRTYLKAKDLEDRYLSKTWFGQCRFTDGKFEGVLIAAKANYYRLVFTINPVLSQPRLEIISTTRIEVWSDNLERL